MHCQLRSKIRVVFYQEFWVVKKMIKIEDLKFINVLDEQCSVSFTGRINVLDKLTRQLRGEFLLIDGRVVAASWGDKRGRSAIVEVAYQDLSLSPLSFIVEPELIAAGQAEVDYSLSQIVELVLNLSEKMNKAQKLKPPVHLKLFLRDDFIKAGANIDMSEYKVMLKLVEVHQVSEIYKKVDLPDYQITDALVSLRKKNAVKVFQ